MHSFIQEQSYLRFLNGAARPGPFRFLIKSPPFRVVFFQEALPPLNTSMCCSRNKTAPPLIAEQNLRGFTNVSKTIKQKKRLKFTF